MAWWMADTLERPFCTEISRFFDFKDGGCPPFWIYKIEIFNRNAL